MAWDLSCPDWETRLRDRRSLIPTLPLFEQDAARAVRAFDLLRLADVEGMPRLGPRLADDPPDLMGDACGDWFRDIVRALFGSYDRAARRRMIREVFCLVPKKNAKTSYGALLMLTALLLNERPRAPFMLTAPVQDTADLAFAQAWGAIEADPVLAKKLHVKAHLKTIVHRETKAELEILTFDPAVVTGKKLVGCMIDELHVIGKMAKAAASIRQIRGGMMPFPEAFLLTITTQSDETPTGVFAADLAQARDVRDGKIQAPVLPVLYELPLEMHEDVERPWMQPEVWPLVNPNWGVSVSEEALTQLRDKAERDGPGELRAWASQHVNIQIGQSLHAQRWPGVDYWMACARPELTLDSILAASDIVTVGVDGGGMDDMLGLVILGRDALSGAWMAWARAWIHRKVLETRKAEAPRFLQFETDGDLVIVEDDSGDQDAKEAAAFVKQAHDSGKLKQIAVDPVGIAAITKAIVDAGVPEELIAAVQQGWRMHTAIKTAERRLAAQTLVHCGRPLMAWCVSNCKQEPRGNAVLITKQASGTAKIDPAMALLDAVYPMAMAPEPNVIGEDHELLVA